MNKLLLNYFSENDFNVNWNSWNWQQKKAIRTIEELKKVFPLLNNDFLTILVESMSKLRFQITPHLISLIEVDKNGNPLETDPIWNQFLPTWDTTIDPSVEMLQENWELSEEMINPILQHKYTNRVNFRIQNNCLSYCMYCFEAKRVFDKAGIKGSFKDEYFINALDYIRKNNNIEEVVISGGEPLTLDNDKYDYILNNLRKIKHVKNIRIQTRAFVHNPYRLDNDFIRLLNIYDVSAIGLHISHPQEISKAFIDVLNRFSNLGCRTLLLAQIPLLKNINDDKKILIDLFMRLYGLKIKPYYLLHAMPDTLGTNKFRTSVIKGVQIIRELRRHFSNPALPEYVIVHESGKHTVPIELEGTKEFEYHKGYVRFKNWRGEWCQYKDVESE